MINSYCLTEEQKKILNSLTCERITASEENFDLTLDFESRRNSVLTTVLQCAAWRADEKGSTVYYVVKNQEDLILLYFSLKCGVLVDPTYEDKLKEYLKEQGFEEIINTPITEGSATGRYKLDIRDESYRKITAYEDISHDRAVENNMKMIRVDETHPAVELVEFCSNDLAKEYWTECGMGEARLGETLFWWFVVPKMQQLQKLVGCKYAYLFAADNEDHDGRLINYYTNVLHFKRFEHLGAVKPIYDNYCYFMCRRLRTIEEDQLEEGDFIQEPDDLLGLDHFREEFLNNFNKPRQ